MDYYKVNRESFLYAGFAKNFAKKFFLLIKYFRAL